MSSAGHDGRHLGYHVRCDEVVEVVSDYLEHALDAADTEAIEQHIVVCSACASYIEQVRATVLAASGLPTEPEDVRFEPLLRLFRTRKVDR